MAETSTELISLNALVIDDSRVMRNMVMQALRQSNLANFEFIEAGNGSEGLGKFDADKINIIFVDWNMPGMDGIEFARQIRAMPWAKDIPIVMITSETGADRQQNAYDKARITCYVTKPFTAEEIESKIGPVIANLKGKGEKTGAPKASNGFFSKLLG